MQTLRASFLAGTMTLLGLTLVARDAWASGVVTDKICPPGATSFVLWKGHVWQQEARSGAEGQLARVVLTFIGPLDGAVLRVRRGPAPSQGEVLFETTLRFEEPGLHRVAVDVTRAAIHLARGESIVLELEGTRASGAERGALVGTTSDVASCTEGLLFQNGTRDGVSPDVRISFVTEMCRGSCSGEPTEPTVLVTPLEPSTPIAGPSLEVERERQRQERDQAERRQQHEREREWQQQQQQHVDEHMHDRPRERREHLSVFLGMGGQAQLVKVDLPDAKLGIGGAIAVHGVAISIMDGFTGRVRGSVALGGQTTGLVTRLEGDASIGPALRLGSAASVFLRGGIALDTHDDRELSASLSTLPSVSTGLQIATSALVVEVGPHAGPALRATYAPGDEQAGRRHHRESANVAASYGGSLVLLTPYTLLDGQIDRVEQKNGLLQAKGRACFIARSDTGRAPSLTVCGWAQYWTAPVVGPTEARDVSSVAAGLGIGFGDRQL
jgi:hypothetical protein